MLVGVEALPSAPNCTGQAAVNRTSWTSPDFLLEGCHHIFVSKVMLFGDSEHLDVGTVFIRCFSEVGISGGADLEKLLPTLQFTRRTGPGVFGFARSG